MGKPNDSAGCASAAFWRYSLALYERPGASEACLLLQERHRLDVNLLLCCCYLGARGCRLDQRRLTAIEAVLEPWRQLAVLPLRGLRRALKTPPDPLAGPDVEALRRQVAEAELAAERVAQRLIAERLPQTGQGRPAPEAVLANLALYAATSAVPLDPEGDAALRQLAAMATTAG